jgi:hypothetical protein
MGLLYTHIVADEKELQTLIQKGLFLKHCEELKDKKRAFHEYAKSMSLDWQRQSSFPLTWNVLIADDLDEVAQQSYTSFRSSSDFQAYGSLTVVDLEEDFVEQSMVVEAKKEEGASLLNIFFVKELTVKRSGCPIRSEYPCLGIVTMEGKAWKKMLIDDLKHGDIQKEILQKLILDDNNEDRLITVYAYEPKEELPVFPDNSSENEVRHFSSDNQCGVVELIRDEVTGLLTLHIFLSNKK